MQLQALRRLGIVAAVISPLVFSQYCGFTKHMAGLLGWPYSGVCRAVFGTEGRADSPWHMHILPDLYTWPSFGMLRSIYFSLGPIPPKMVALIVVGAAYLMPLSLAFYNWSAVPRRAWWSLALPPAVFAGLGWIVAAGPLEPAAAIAGPLLTALYFLEFAVIFPLLARRPRPHSVF